MYGSDRILTSSVLVASLSEIGGRHISSANYWTVWLTFSYTQPDKVSHFRRKAALLQMSTCVTTNHFAWVHDT